MSRKLEDEDYWNSSDTTGFCFDDDEISSASSLFESSKLSGSSKFRSDTTTTSGSNSNLNVFGEFSVVLSTAKSLETLVSKRSIAAILDEGVRDVSTQSPSVASTIRAINQGKPYNLQNFRSLESKTQLLEEAVKSGDGNAILCVLLYLRNTLKKKLFCKLLQFQPAALPVYENYLTTRFEIRSVVDILLMLGKVRTAALKDFQFLIQPHQRLDKRQHNLKALLRDHFSQPNTEDKEFMENFSKFVDWQMSATHQGFSPAGTVSGVLHQLCSDHWHEVRGQPLSPMTLTNLLHVTDRQFHWAAITSRAKAQAWDDIGNLLLAKGWLGAKKIKSVVPVERIIVELHRQKAPENVLMEYFPLLENMEKRLEIARKLSWHRAVIDTYVGLRDRQGLVLYQTALNPQSNDYLHAEIALRNSSNKWKN